MKQNKLKQLLLLLLIFTFSATVTFGQVCGDVNADGIPTIRDALLIAQCYVNLVSCPSVDIGDVNCDGSISILDALLIAQLYVNLIDTLACCDAPTQEPDPTPTPGTIIDGPMGWVTEGDGCTGGGNAAPELVTSLSALNNAAGGSDARVIYVDGQFSGSLRVGSNKTIIGLPGAKVTSATFPGSHNVIMRNLTLEGGTDTINTNGATNLWFDHLDLSDGSDGVLDIIKGSDYITVSYTKFWYDRGGDHKNVCLVGNSDGASGDRGKMRVTFYKCWWDETASERMPRVRYGRVHVLNNLYTCTGNNYCIAPGVYSNILAERNIFIDVNTALAADWYNSSADATLADVGNVFLGSTTGREGKYGDPVFVPPYDYVADEPNDALEAEVRANAGATMNVTAP